ncbi:MAG: type II secretion system protein [Phycisphaerales bacterium]|nr:type II secretion system protein [Phycisphaerales bacterium]
MHTLRTVALPLSPPLSPPFCFCKKSARRGRNTRAFTLVEFLVVISIVVILTSMLMPALSQARRAGARLECLNNMRQIGAGLITYADDWNNRLPPSSYAPTTSPRIGEMLCLTTSVSNGEAKLDGLGLLLSRMGGYVTDERCLYCPSHHGHHDYERYVPEFAHASFSQRVFSNYQYRGDMDYTDILRPRRRSDPLGSRTILLADGFRTRTDFNHRTGSNRLKGDGSVDWWVDAGQFVVSNTPSADDDSAPPPPMLELYLAIWKRIDQTPQD